MRDAIEDVVNRYAWGYDEGVIEAATEVFVEEGTLETSVSGLSPARGHAEIRAFLAAARDGRAERGEQPRHLITNIVIDDASGGRATVRSYMTLVITHADGSATVDCAGTYHDRMVEIDGRWKLEHRRIVFDRDREA